MKTSLGIWAFGSMGTRFVPGGYQPQWNGESTVHKVERAVAGLDDVIDGYEFHFPQELSADNLAAVTAALGGHDVYAIASGLHLDPLFGRGAFCSPASPRPSAIGNMPRIIASAVISTGRNRPTPDSHAAFSGSSPL